MGDDDPLLSMVTIERLEAGVGESDTPQWLEAQAWLGRDLRKVWLKTDVEREGSATDSADLELLYGQAVAPYWDLQLGWKRDFQPGPTRDWLAVGFQGLAPYLFELDSALYLAASRASLKVEAAYDLLFTQRLILSPRVELIFNSYNEERTGAGDGLSTTEAGLRLRYEIRREFAPYLGVHWEQSYGNTADYRRNEGQNRGDVYFVAGIRAWF
jgi:copper resistance protein B